MTEIILNNFTDKDNKKKKQIFIAQEHQPQQLSSENAQPPQQQLRQHKDEELALENEWSFWEDHYINNNNSIASIDEYLKALMQLNSFSTIQDFWNCFNIIPSISKLPNNSCFHLFKKGIRPIWEENQDGGEFVIKVKKIQTDEVWNELVLSVIGEQFSSYLQDNDDICGISIRKKQGMDFNMIHIWNKNIKGKEHIPRAIKHLFPLLLDECIHFYYKEHAGVKNQLPSNSGSRLTQLRNMNKSTSVLKPTANAFVPRKSVRFNLSKSKSESTIGSPKQSKKVEKSAMKHHLQPNHTFGVLEQSPMQVDVKPILSKRTANIPLSFDTITDLKPKEIHYQKLNKEDQGIVDELDLQIEKEEEKQVQKLLEKEIEKEILKRRQEESELEESEESEFEEAEEGIIDEMDKRMDREDEQKFQKQLEKEIEKEIIKRRQGENEKEDQEFDESDDNEIVPQLKNDFQNDEFVPEKEENLDEESKPKISFSFDPVEENDKLKHLNDFNLSNQVENELKQEKELQEAKSLIDNDLVQDENEIKKKLDNENQSKKQNVFDKQEFEEEMDKEIDEIVDELSESEVDEELNEQIDEWENELGVDDPNHEIRNGFKNEFSDELKEYLREDIKESVKDEVHRLVNAKEVNPTISTPPFTSKFNDTTSSNKSENTNTSANSNNNSATTASSSASSALNEPIEHFVNSSNSTTTTSTTDSSGNPLLDTLSDIPTIEENWD
ncbi:hypothetical protein RB653_006541 [Dictyostelium firmibasis]|uniref:Uncharacterized protein n=1 Tax=Dictyostelium firmibasis TaxID=79012 RepID=A0AAN7TUB2_9MYCE